MSRQKCRDNPAASSPDIAPRTFLPRDLAASLRHLPEPDIIRLAVALAAEIEARKLTVRKPPGQPSRKTASDPALVQLTRSQISLIRSSIQAGVKPAALSRQFGLTRAQIAAALKAEN